MTEQEVNIRNENIRKFKSEPGTWVELSETGVPHYSQLWGPGNVNPLEPGTTMIGQGPFDVGTDQRSCQVCNRKYSKDNKPSVNDVCKCGNVIIHVGFFNDEPKNIAVAKNQK